VQLERENAQLKRSLTDTVGEINEMKLLIEDMRTRE
jgi:hypothetical protein